MSDFIKNDIAARLSQRLTARVAGTRSGRFDLKLTDYEVSSPIEARIMVAYSKEMGFPKRAEIDEWATSSFNGNVRLVLETLRNYPELNVVTAFVGKNRTYRPLTASKGMMVVGKAKFLDSDKTVWEVTTTRDGERFLARAEKDDLEEILKLRMTKERTATVHHRLRLADLVTAGIHNLDPGDRVRFSYEGILQQGGVSTVGKDNVTIKANGQSLTVDRLAVVDVYEKSQKSKAEQDAYLKKIFTEMYGDEAFANALVDVGD